MAERIKLTNPLSNSDIEFRVDQIREYNSSVYAILIPYKTSRVDMQRLDWAVGEMNWQCSYMRDSKGVLQCGIGIWDGEKKQWVWKYSNGTPSMYESEKGEYSDAFKRAGFMWGIGRELYNFPRISVTMNDKEFSFNNGKYKATGYFKPNDWDWEINEDYTSVIAKQGSNQRYNSNPYKK